jgi:hypothetical protein
MSATRISQPLTASRAASSFSLVLVAARTRAPRVRAVPRLLPLLPETLAAAGGAYCFDQYSEENLIDVFTNGSKNRFDSPGPIGPSRKHLRAGEEGPRRQEEKVSEASRRIGNLPTSDGKRVVRAAQDHAITPDAPEGQEWAGGKQPNLHIDLHSFTLLRS